MTIAYELWGRGDNPLLPYPYFMSVPGDGSTSYTGSPRTGSMYSAGEYAQAIRSLLPRGRVWKAEPGSVQGALVDGLAAIYATTDAAAIRLIREAFPATAGEMLPEWNATVGIPDFCFGAPTSTAENIRQLVTKLTATGGQSVPFFERLAQTLGFEIRIHEFSPSRPGSGAPPGMITTADDWAHTWQVQIDPSFAPSMLHVGDPVGLPLAVVRARALDCLLTRFKPAHTQFYYLYAPITNTRHLRVTDSVAAPLTLSV